MDQHLLKMVKRKTKRGYPEGELRNDLRLQGISEEEITELFDAITKNDSTRSPRVSQGEQMRLLISACLIITSLAFLSLSFQLTIGWFFMLPGVVLLLPSVVKKMSGSFERP